jgi:hypothetical protein
MGEVGREQQEIFSFYFLFNTKDTEDTKKKLAVVGGGRNEETYSKYAAGVRIKQLPSRRQQRRFRRVFSILYSVYSWRSLAALGLGNLQKWGC